MSTHVDQRPQEQRAESGREVTRYRIRVGELFPSTDPVILELLRLMAAVNDLRTLQQLWLLAQSRLGKSESEKDIIRAESIYLFRLTCATLYEAGLAFQSFRDALARAGRNELISTLPPDAQEAFHTLENLFQDGFEKRGWGNVLCQLRNSIFHFPNEKLVRHAISMLPATGIIMIGEIAAVSRYLLVDELQVQVLLRPLKAGDASEQLEMIRMVAETMGSLTRLVNEVVVRCGRDAKSAIVEEQEDGVDPVLMWGRKL